MFRSKLNVVAEVVAVVEESDVVPVVVVNDDVAEVVVGVVDGQMYW